MGAELVGLVPGQTDELGQVAVDLTGELGRVEAVAVGAQFALLGR